MCSGIEAKIFANAKAQLVLRCMMKYRTILASFKWDKVDGDLESLVLPANPSDE
jgi:hypothetical protein